GAEPFARMQRNPAHIAESEAQAPPAAPAEEADHSGPPIVASAISARIPRPAEAALVPVAVVIRSPAPRIAAHPGPAIVGFIHPAAHAVGSPAGVDRRHPDVAILGVGCPAAVPIQLFGA